MSIKNPFQGLNRWEWLLWLTSVGVVSASFLTVPEKDYLTLAASLIGVTALIFVAKGYVIGQVLTVVFAVLERLTTVLSVFSSFACSLLHKPLMVRRRVLAWFSDRKRALFTHSARSRKSVNL